MSIDVSETSSASAPVQLRMLDEHVALVTINRPDTRNAVNADITIGLEQAVVLTEQDANVWVVILTGAGNQAFCAGADLQAVAAGQGASLTTLTGGFAGFVHQPRTKPWIAAVNGIAVAGGTEIALACDLIVAVRHATFGLPEVKRGLIAAAGGLYRLTRSLPRSIGLELIATGEPLSAEKANHYGLLNRLVQGHDPVPEALLLARTIAANAPVAVRESLKIARVSYDLPDAELRRLSEEAFRALMITEDFAEGPRAFIEKRAPIWRGQ